MDKTEWGEERHQGLSTILPRPTDVRVPVTGFRVRVRVRVLVTSIKVRVQVRSRPIKARIGGRNRAVCHVPRGNVNFTPAIGIMLSLHYMPLALSVEEIRSLICSQLDPGTKLDRATLFHLALTSHAWTDPALNLLWTEANDAKMIFPLFSWCRLALLDADDANEVRIKECPSYVPVKSNRSQMPARPPLTKGLARFKFYAAHVRCLKLSIEKWSLSTSQVSVTGKHLWSNSSRRVS